MENVDVLASDKDSVLSEIGGIIHQVSIMGFNDHEIPTLNKLMEEVRSGAIDPGKALEEARAVLSRKQDYH